MNLTIISLITSSLQLSKSNGLSSISPFYSISTPIIFNLEKSKFSRFFSPIISFNGYSSKIIDRSTLSITLYQDKFSHFLKRALELASNEIEITGDQQSKRFVATSGTTNVNVKKCQFENMNEVSEGAAIYVNIKANVKVQSTIFDGMKVTGKGGAIFYEYNADDTIFYSNYNCFSNIFADYGSAIHGKAGRIEIYFSGTTACTGGSGAQMDIESKYIKSSHLNLTGGVSTYAGAMEYRGATDGEFIFQTISNFSSCFTMSLTDTGNGLKVSESNIVDCIVKNNPHQARPSIYFQHGGESTVTDFCVFRCKLIGKSSVNYDAKFSSIRWSNGENDGTTTIIGLVTDLKENDVIYGISNIKVSGIIKYEDRAAITLDIQQLNLGECAGEEVAPDYPTLTPKATATQSPPPTYTPTQSLYPTKSPMATLTQSPMATLTKSLMATLTKSPMATLTKSPMATLTKSPKSTATEIPHGTPEPTKSPSQSPISSNFFSESNVFTESEFFNANPEQKSKSGLSKRKIIIIIAGCCLSFLILIIIIIVVVIIWMKRKAVQNFSSKNNETNNDDELTDNEVSDHFVLND